MVKGKENTKKRTKSMNDLSYSVGDWIVHVFHGVGKIVKEETKTISGDQLEYFRVETKDRTIWIPRDELDPTRHRLVSTPYQFRKALQILKRPAHEMDLDHMVRKVTIGEASSEISLDSLCRIIRDLNARQASNELNFSEEQAFDRFTDRLIQEWSVCMGIDREEARKRLYKILRKNQEEQPPD